MAADPIDTLLASLVAAKLITPTQQADIRTWATAHSADRAAVAKELVRRGWLTLFQVKEVAKGQLSNLTIGPYLLIDVLGEGGMGRVYRAKHTRLNRQVALKVIRKEKLTNPQAVNRFQQEIHAAAQLTHPNVIHAYDAESDGSNLFLSMEYADGTDLTKLVLANGPMPVATACDAIRQAALGLQHAHEQGLVHRDIKPSNLLYTPKGQVKVLDLGLALLNQSPVQGGEQANRVTQDGFVIGTPDFLAPEQAQNPTGVDIRADIYSLGATLFYLLTARVPFDGSTKTEKLIRHITEPPPSLLPFRSDAPPQLDAVVRWMMAKRPAERPQTPDDVVAALTPFCLPPAATVAHDEPTAAVNLFGGFDAIEQADRPGRVREPKKASSLPLLFIGGGVLLTLGVVGLIAAYMLLVAPMMEKESPLEEEFANSVGLRMKRLEAGSFTMGSPDDENGRDKSEGPQHRVTLSSPFFISVTEVPRGVYVAVMKSSPGPVPAGLAEKYVDRIPAAGVSWPDANEFCRRLNLLEATRRKGWEYRLPTEAEWEYAARAGSDEPFPLGRKVTQYTHGIFKLLPNDPYGEVNAEVKSEKYQFENRPAPIDPKEGDNDYQFRRTPNRWGLHDTTGNVWEWCQDYYGDYSADEATDPRGPSEGTWRVLRGGAFDSSTVECRVAARRGLDPATKASNIGFRVVFAPKTK